MLIKQSQTARPLVFFMTDEADHISGKTGLSPTVTISKDGAAFGSPAGAVSEIGSGWYKVAGNATDSGTLGPLLLHATAAGADPTDREFRVVAFDPDLATNLGLSALPTANPNASGGLAIVGSQVDLVNAPNATALAAIANKVETEIIDDTDSEKVLEAITNKIAAVNPSLEDLTLAAIAAAVRDVANTSPAANSLGAAVKAVADRTPGSGTLATSADVPSAASVAAAAAAQVTADHGSGSYARNTEPLDATGTRSAIGLATNNLDTQLAAKPTAAAVADAVWDELRSGHMTAGSYGEWFSLLCLRLLAFGLVVRNSTHFLVYDTDGETLLLSIPFVYDGDTEQMGPGE